MTYVLSDHKWAPEVLRAKFWVRSIGREVLRPQILNPRTYCYYCLVVLTAIRVSIITIIAIIVPAPGHVTPSSDRFACCLLPLLPCPAWPSYQWPFRLVLSTPVVPFCPFCWGVSLLKLKSRKKSTLMLMGYWGT